MTKHTKTPWEHSDVGNAWVIWKKFVPPEETDRENYVRISIAAVYGQDDTPEWKSYEEARANLALFLGAEALLEACEKALALLEHDGPPDCMEHDFLREAIAGASDTVVAHSGEGGK